MTLWLRATNEVEPQTHALAVRLSGRFVAQSHKGFLG